MTTMILLGLLLSGPAVPSVCAVAPEAHVLESCSLAGTCSGAGTLGWGGSALVAAGAALELCREEYAGAECVVEYCEPAAVGAGVIQ